MTVLSIDLETFSGTDIRYCGLHKYVEDPQFEILLFAYAFDDEPVEIIDLAQIPADVIPDGVWEALHDDSIQLSAFNAQFERTCINKFFGLSIPASRYHCSMVHSLMLGLPGNLDGVAKALRLSAQKDSVGKSLIQYFSKPCKPTKTNGGRIRNLPEHAPEKWDLFKGYCKQDVEVERAIGKKLQAFPIPENEQKLWALDQDINSRGVEIDPVLVENAIRADEEYHKKLIDEAVSITGLHNPNSVAQIKTWIEAENGTKIKSLSKKTIPDLLKSTEDKKVKRILEIRTELAKTSVKKYSAMERAMCRDKRVRGLLQFYGASRTGRWAGRIVQVQNLPRNHLKDLELARNLIKAGRHEDVALLYESLPDILSQLIRTAFVAKPGHRFIVADFSAIESRVLGYLAGEEWKLKVFKGDGKIYEQVASRMFKVPIEKISKGNPEYELRQKGKVAELACIAEGQLVLTNKGLTPIEEVTKAQLVWDGKGFVKHDGVVCRGVREVISYEGLTATPDHLVWICGESEPIHFGIAASSRKHLLRTGNRGKAIRLGRNHKPRKKVYKTKVAGAHGSYEMHQLRARTVGNLSQLNQGEIKRMPSLLTAKKNSILAGQATNRCKTTLRESERQGLPQLWSTRYTILLLECNGSGSMDYREPGSTKQSLRYRPHRKQRKLRARKFKIRNQKGELLKSTHHNISGVESRRMAVLLQCSPQNAEKGPNPRRNLTEGDRCCAREAQELARNKKKARVYDILNAGPNHRFTVSGCLVHNCGYSGGPNALIAMGALEKGLTEEELPAIVKGWRDANPKVVQLWYDLDKAAKKAVRDKTAVALHHGIAFSYRAGILFLRLPSGRELAYVRPRIEKEEKFDRSVVTYEGYEEGRWSRKKGYSGLWAENLTQAVARDCLAEAMLRISAAGYNIVFHVHDEIITETGKAAGSLDELINIMSTPISWAPGLPLNAAGFTDNFYRKD